MSHVTGLYIYHTILFILEWTFSAYKKFAVNSTGSLILLVSTVSRGGVTFSCAWFNLVF